MAGRIYAALFFKGDFLMKQKYSILTDTDNGNMTIKEFAELDKGMFSLIFEETYAISKLQAAIDEGKEALIAVIRTPNLYPIAEYVDKIADAVISQLGDTPAEEPVELVFNDIKLMQKAPEKPEDAEDTEEDEDSVEIDSLLDDDKDSAKTDKTHDDDD